MGGGSENQGPDHCPGQPLIDDSNAGAAAAPRVRATDHPPPTTAAAAAAAAAAGSQPPACPLAVPHFQQAYSWDCGLACVLMALRALGMSHHSMATLMRLCPSRSIWTIDLAHLLAACGAHVRMLTVTIGVNQVYCGERFYAETMRADSARVDELFRTAAAAGVEVQQRSLPLADLTALVAGGTHLVLALVDKSTLASSSAATSAEAGAAAAAAAHARDGPRAGGGSGSSGSGGSGSGGAAEAAAGHCYQHRQQQPDQRQQEEGSGAYLGHYILLVDYDEAAAAFEYRDPAMDRPRLWVPAARLEAARKRFGTDEDLLLVSCCGGAGSGGGTNLPAAPAGAASSSQQQQLEPGGPAAAGAAGAL